MQCLSGRLRHATAGSSSRKTSHTLALPCAPVATPSTPHNHVTTTAPCRHPTAARAAQQHSQFDVDAPKEDRADLGPREDDVLPEDLADAISQAAAATAEAIRSGSTRMQVEILLPEFWDPISGPMFPNRGDQDRFWRITRRFVELLAAAANIQPAAVNAVYPDAGVAAMLSHQWSLAVDPDAPPVAFKLTSLNDRRPIKAEDELIVLACPDPPGADDAVKLIRQVSSQDEEQGTLERPIVMFNQRLSSGDVGLGLNARRLRDRLLKQFTVTYSLRPIGDIGSVYRRYPGLWQVFLEDPEMPGRYKLITTQPARPQGETLDYLVQQALGNVPAEGEDGKQAQGFLGQLARTVNGLQYFMKSLTK